jgi:hypothetical protein
MTWLLTYVGATADRAEIVQVVLMPVTVVVNPIASHVVPVLRLICAISVRVGISIRQNPNCSPVMPYSL